MDFKTRKELADYSKGYEDLYNQSEKTKFFYTPNQVNEIIGILMTMKNKQAFEYIQTLQGQLSVDLNKILKNKELK